MPQITGTISQPHLAPMFCHPLQQCVATHCMMLFQKLYTQRTPNHLPLASRPPPAPTHSTLSMTRQSLTHSTHDPVLCYKHLVIHILSTHPDVISVPPRLLPSSQCAPPTSRDQDPDVRARQLSTLKRPPPCQLHPDVPHTLPAQHPETPPTPTLATATTSRHSSHLLRQNRSCHIHLPHVSVARSRRPGPPSRPRSTKAMTPTAEAPETTSAPRRPPAMHAPSPTRARGRRLRTEKVARVPRAC